MTEEYYFKRYPCISHYTTKDGEHREYQTYNTKKLKLKKMRPIKIKKTDLKVKISNLTRENLILLNETIQTLLKNQTNIINVNESAKQSEGTE